MTLSPSNRLVQGFWSGPLTTMERLSMQSFVAAGHEFHLYVYDGNLLGVPPSVHLRNAAEIIPVKEAATFRCVQQLSDQFRITLLLKRGGWYVDLDTICLQPFDFSSDYIFYRDYDESTISFAVSKAPVGSPLMQHCHDYLSQLTAEDRQRLSWQEIGTEFVTGAVEFFGLQKFAQPGYTFDPIQWQRAREVVNPEAKWDLSRSHAVHLFHAVWNGGPKDRLGRGFDLGQDLDARLDTDGEYHPDCLYEQLKRKFLTNGATEWQPSNLQSSS